MLDNSTNCSDEWVRCYTLGGRNKEFCWKLDNASTLYIDRLFEAGSGGVKFTSEQIDQIADYVAQNCEVILGNNREKLVDGTEEEGLGKFIKETLNLGVSYAMASSQLSALFKEAQIWQWNERKRGMTFRIIRTNWRQQLREYYNSAINSKVV